MKTLFVSILLAGMAFSSCTTVDEPTQPQATQPEAFQKTVKFDFGGGLLIFNECCNEWVLARGEGVILFDDKQDFPKHITVRNLTGMGYDRFPFEPGATPTGHTYTARGASTVQWVMHEDGSRTAKWKQAMVNEDGCSFFYHAILHITVDENGDPKVTIDKVTITCE